MVVEVSLRPIGTFRVVPSLPPALEPLRALAYNLRWSWSHESIDLFRRIDPDLWEATGHNPVLVLARVDQARFQELTTDEAFLHHMDAARSGLDAYMAAMKTWYRRTHDGTGEPVVAYFSAEFGVTECLSIFAAQSVQ